MGQTVLPPQPKQRNELLAANCCFSFIRDMILKVLVLVAACVASSQALNCLSCSGNCIATPGGTYESIACDQGVKFCTLLIKDDKPTSMGCDTDSLTSQPIDVGLPSLIRRVQNLTKMASQHRW